MNELKNQDELSNYGWYTIEELAELCGYASAHAMQSNPKLLELLNRLSNSNNTKLGGYHNTRKFYSKDILEAIKKYQIENATPNALKNKDAAIQGNVSYIETATVKQTIDNLLDNPNTLQMLLTESLERNKKLGIENKANEKLLYGEITCLANANGYCYAGNAYFAKLYGVVIRQNTKDSFLSLTDLQEAYTHARIENGWCEKRVDHILAGKENSERLYYLLFELKIINVDFCTFMQSKKKNKN